MPSVSRKRLRPIPRSRRVDVTRGEYNELVDRLNERGRVVDGIHDEIRKALDLQFRRIAQLQAELDELKVARRRKS